jgi:hypothetical protein
MGMEGKARNARAADIIRNTRTVVSGFACASIASPGNNEASWFERGDVKYPSERTRTAAK